MGKQMETTKIGVLNCELTFQEKHGGGFRNVTWHPGTVVEIHDFHLCENVYYKVERLHYQESPGVKIYYNDNVKFSMCSKRALTIMNGEDIKWKLLVFESLGKRWRKVK